eukprot:196217-Chlamydomonas_euryale.AAC.5
MPTDPAHNRQPARKRFSRLEAPAGVASRRQHCWQLRTRCRALHISIHLLRFVCPRVLWLTRSLILPRSNLSTKDVVEAAIKHVFRV